MERIKAADMVEEKRATPKWLILGPTKKGKTTSLLTWPEDENLLVVNLWGNKEVLIGAPNIEIVDYEGMDPEDPLTYVQFHRDFNEIIGEAKQGTLGANCLCIDTLTGFGDLLLNYVLTLDKASGESMAKGVAGSPQEAHYRGVAHLARAFVEQLTLIRMSVILIAHVEYFEDFKRKTAIWRPICPGNRLRSVIGTYFGEIYLAWSEAKVIEGITKLEFGWQTMADDSWPILGSTLNRWGKVWGMDIDQNFRSVMERSGIRKRG